MLEEQRVTRRPRAYYARLRAGPSRTGRTRRVHPLTCAERFQGCAGTALSERHRNPKTVAKNETHSAVHPSLIGEFKQVSYPYGILLNIASAQSNRSSGDSLLTCLNSAKYEDRSVCPVSILLSAYVKWFSGRHLAQPASIELRVYNWPLRTKVAAMGDLLKDGECSACHAGYTRASLSQPEVGLHCYTHGVIPLPLALLSGSTSNAEISMRVQTRKSSRHTCRSAYTYLSEHPILSLEGAWAQATGRSAGLRHTRRYITYIRIN